MKSYRSWLLVVAAVLVVALVVALTVGRKWFGTTNDDPTPTAPTGTATSATSGSETSGATRATPASDDVPVAYYKASEHEMFTKYKSPDRTTVTSDTLPKGFIDAPAGSGMDRYLNQKLEWTTSDCQSGEECATIKVPLDWDQPDGRAITMVLARKAATDSTKLGSMFINPGGPGASGVDMLKDFDAKKFPGYDVIGWDVRGTGKSTPVVCGTKDETTKYLDVDNSPDNAAEMTALRQGQIAFDDQCRKNSGVLLDHISSIDTARDMDYLRYLVGDKQFNYLGISYGTYIGAMYAELYPKRVGRMVLDSAVNITDNESVIQAMGFDLALRNFAKWCAGNRSKCTLGTSEDAVIQSITKLWDSLDSKPLDVDGRQLTQSLGLTGTALFLYWGTQGYEQMAQTLQLAIQGDGSILLRAADLLNGRDENGNYDPMTYAFPAIACKDSADDGWNGAMKQWPLDEKKAPIFAKYWGPGVTCVLWTSRPADQIKIVAKGAANPIVVMGVTGDPATPYQQAVWMADQLDTGRLVTWKGAGHSAYELGNSCAKDTVTNWINKGQAPADKTTC